MFQSIIFNGKEPDANIHLYKLTYTLEDSDFTLRIHVPIEKNIYHNRENASVIPSGLISIYEQYKKNVPKNLALFYVKTIGKDPIGEQNKLLHADRIWTDKYFPTLNYTTKYFKCVLSQMKILNYTGIVPDAKHIIRPAI